MNSHVIPQGPQETITNGTLGARPTLILYAETDLVLTALIYEFQAAPANAGAIAAFTLKAGRYLYYVKSCAFTGTATVTYKR